MNTSKSKCCNYSVLVGGHGTTHYYVCGKCGESCDCIGIKIPCKDRTEGNFVLLKSVTGERFYTWYRKDHDFTKTFDGKIGYKIIGFADTMEESQMELYGRIRGFNSKKANDGFNTKTDKNEYIKNLYINDIK